jgi:outer membrane lipoprotein-sorting protein
MPFQAYADLYQKDVNKAEQYLNSLSTIKARFLQTSQDGTQLIGTFYLNRPGRLRFEYDKPVDDFVVADGFFIYFYDALLKQQTNAPIGQTLADFILRDNLSLTDDITITEIKKSGGLLLISLAQSSDLNAGTLILGFEEHPLKLKKWRIIDPYGATTELELFKIQENISLPDELFVYIDPNKDTLGYND